MKQILDLAMLARNADALRPLMSTNGPNTILTHAEPVCLGVNWNDFSVVTSNMVSQTSF
jgi:hypothetical protein